MYPPDKVFILPSELLKGVFSLYTYILNIQFTWGKHVFTGKDALIWTFLVSCVAMFLIRGNWGDYED